MESFSRDGCVCAIVTLRPARRVLSWATRCAVHGLTCLTECGAAIAECGTGLIFSPNASGCGCIWGIERLVFGPRWNSFKDAPKKKGRRPVVCVAGLASSALDAKRTEGCLPCCPPLCPRRKVTYCSISALSMEPLSTLRSLKLRLREGKLQDGRLVKCTESIPGLDVRPVKGTAGISSLNPGESVPVSVWSGLINGLCDKLNFYAFNYDWRRWGDRVYAEELVKKFMETVETANSDSRVRTSSFMSCVTCCMSLGHSAPKVAIVAHSMGAPVVLYCLSKLPSSWVKKYVDEVILVGPAHMGSPSMLPSFAAGPVAAMIPSTEFLTHGVGDICATWACMVAEMPVMVGDAAPWPADYAFAYTPKETYRLADMGRFLDDVAKCSKNKRRDFGPALFPGVLELASEMKAPTVTTRIVFSSGTATMAQVEYESEDLILPPKVKSTEPGDGTIVSESIRRVAEHWKRGGAKISLHEAPGEISHKDLISCSFTLDIVANLANKRF